MSAWSPRQRRGHQRDKWGKQMLKYSLNQMQRRDLFPSVTPFSSVHQSIIHQFFFLYLSIKLPAVYTVVVFLFYFFVIRIVFSFKSHTVWPNSSVLVFCFCKCLLRLLIMNCFSLIKYLIACQMVCTTFTLADHDSSFQMPSWAITRASLCIHIYMDICNPIGSIKATKRLCCNLVYKSFL